MTGGVQDAIPPLPPEHVKLTMTLELFQPLAFAGGDTEAVIFGAVLLIFRVTLAVAVFPALSVAAPEII